VLQARINVNSPTELTLTANGTESWPPCNLLRDGDPAGFDLLAKYDKQSLHITGDGYASACGDALYFLTVAAIYAPESVAKTNSQQKMSDTPKRIYLGTLAVTFLVGLSFLLYSLGYKRAAAVFAISCLLVSGPMLSGRERLLCKNCGRIGYSIPLLGVRCSSSSYGKFILPNAESKLSEEDCDHSWVTVTSPALGIGHQWFGANQGNNPKAPIIFKTEEDFYHAAFWVGLGKDKRANDFLMGKDVTLGMKSALNAKDKCYDLLVNEQTYLAEHLSIPMNYDNSEKATERLTEILVKFGHMKSE